MWRYFEFADGSNPYITETNKEFFHMLCTYEIQQRTNKLFIVWEPKKQAKSYTDKQSTLRDFAIDWQTSADDYNINYSWGELAEWENFFTEYGRKYGLIREFKENGII